MLTKALLFVLFRMIAKQLDVSEMQLLITENKSKSTEELGLYLYFLLPSMMFQRNSLFVSVTLFDSYTMETPSRFKKELLHPYATRNGTVQVEQLNALLQNIGHSEACLSTQEQNELLREAGCSGRELDMKSLLELIG
jgi:hypothetical protein